MLNTDSLPIDKIYVPVKRRKSLNPQVVHEIAESILEIGQITPILVRPDEDRLVLVEGLHRLEACKALGEKTIIGRLVSAQAAHQKPHLPESAEVEAERLKMQRLRKLRLEKEAAEKLAKGSGADEAQIGRDRQERYIRNTSRSKSSQLDGRPSASTPKTLSDWFTKQERDGFRY